MKKNSMAIITYHSAYNYGSALQAYATQQALLNLGYSAELINYRMNEQKYFYRNIPRTKYGLHVFLNDLTLLAVRKKRSERSKLFERFFRDYLSRSKEINESEEVEDMWKQYDTIISGSDQIWN